MPQFLIAPLLFGGLGVAIVIIMTIGVAAGLRTRTKE